THDEAAVLAFEVVVEVGAADAAGAEAKQHLARADVRHVERLDPQILLGVNPACEHRNSPVGGRLTTSESVIARASIADAGRAQCTMFQPLVKRLYALFKCRCIAARAPATSCSAIAFSTARCSAIAAVHNPGVS